MQFSRYNGKHGYMSVWISLITTVADV